jgi:antitoxin component YwqK of YwqJK toxin-antitoxin module
MSKPWPWLAGLTGSGLLLVSCGDSAPPPGETAQPVGAPKAQNGTLTVTVKEVAMNKGVLFLRSNSSPFTGLVNDKWPNGKLKYQCVYKDGQKDGPELAWHEDGAKKMAAQFKTGNQEGQTQHWWPNGQPMSMMTYLNGKPHGEAKGWHDNGTVARSERYEGGLKMGKSEGWWKNGKLADQTTYLNGKPNGWQVKWFASGKTNSVVFYANGNKQGVSTTWYPNGQRGQYVTFVNGKPNGDVFEWHPNGQQKAQEKYVNGVQQGPGAGWFENGKVKWQGTWKDGQRHGIFIGYHTNGMKMLQIEYNAGIRKRKTSFNIQGQKTEELVTPTGLTFHWTAEQLTNINNTKQQISKLFGRPKQIVGNVWIYSGIHIIKGRKIQTVSIRITFDPSGTQSNVTMQEPETKRPPEGGPKE